MTSQARIEANRKNARRSTGPKTAAGKARSRANALKHGLAAKLLQDGQAVARSDRLCNHLHDDFGVCPEQARTIGECEIMLRRIGTLKATLMENMLHRSPEGERRSRDIQLCCEQLSRLERYERRATSLRNRAIRGLDAAENKNAGSPEQTVCLPPRPTIADTKAS
jgi:hypothetical protein